MRVEADTRRGERDAERAGESYGRSYAKGAQRGTDRDPVKPRVAPLDDAFEKQVKNAIDNIVKTASANIPLTIKGEELRAKVAAQVAEIERTLKAKIPTDPAEAVEYRRKLAAMVRESARAVRAKIDTDVDKDGVRRAANTFSSLASTGTGLFARLSTGIRSAVSEGVSGFTSMSGPLLTVLKAIFAIQYVVPGIAAGISLLGGTAVAAFGAISAGALGLPVLLTSILSPIAAITLGMDGIKRATLPVQDEFKRLKDVVNTTFELNMRPVFEKLQAVFPTLSVGLSETARAVSRLAMDLTGVVTSEAGMENLRVATLGFSDVVDHAREGLAGLFTSLLNVAGTQGLYVILGDTIGGVAARFGNMIERVRSSGDLAAALTQLRDLLFGVTDMLNVLIEGSIKFFAAAGPGLSDFFASLTEVLSRIDWAGLGESFGGMMERVGKAIQDIPPEKWQELGDAIGALSEKFIKMVEEGTFIDFINGIVGIANTLFYLKSGIDAVEEGINGLNDMLEGAGQAIYDNIFGPFYRAVGDLFGFLGIGSPAQKFIDIGISIIQGILAGLAAGPALVFSKVRELATKAIEALADAGTLLVDKGRQLVEGVKNGIGSKLEEARAKASEIKSKVQGALSAARDWLFGPGADMVEGFIRGIGSKISSAASKAAEMARAAYNAAKSALGISSPSTLFADIGRDTIAGFLVGLRDRIAPMMAQIQSLFTQAASVAGSSLQGGLGDVLSTANGPSGLISNVLNQAIGAASGGQFDPAALAAAFSGLQLTARFDGPNVVTLVNDENRKLARR